MRYGSNMPRLTLEHPVRDLRKAVGFSQAQLAARAGMTQPGVANAEARAGGITLGSLQSLCRASGFDLVLSVTPTEKPKPLRPFFHFWGSKWSLARHYPAPEHDTVIEPFAGGAGYALRHYQRNVVLVERDPEIAALWRWLIRVKPSEIKRHPPPWS